MPRPGRLFSADDAPRFDTGLAVLEEAVMLQRQRPPAGKFSRRVGATFLLGLGVEGYRQRGALAHRIQ